MQIFHVRYRNAQGALMRILNAVSRRGLDLTSVRAEYSGKDYSVTLWLEVSPKQVGQLYREWYAIVDVVNVQSSAAFEEREEFAWTPHPPPGVSVEGQARAALA